MKGRPIAPTIWRLNPDGMHNNPAFSQAVSVQGDAKTISIGGQNAVAAAGATLPDIITWTIYMVQGQDVRPAFGVFQQIWGTSARPPAISVIVVAGLANPEFLVEIEAIAVTGREASSG